MDGRQEVTFLRRRQGRKRERGEKEREGVRGVPRELHITYYHIGTPTEQQTSLRQTMK